MGGGPTLVVTLLIFSHLLPPVLLLIPTLCTVSSEGKMDDTIASRAFLFCCQDGLCDHNIALPAIFCSHFILFAASSLSFHPTLFSSQLKLSRTFI